MGSEASRYSNMEDCAVSMSRVVHSKLDAQPLRSFCQVSPLHHSAIKVDWHLPPAHAQNDPSLTASS
jgi:hypothetical protein